ncbi:MAG: AMP-binding protein, partial [Chloroflexota bacterium]
MEKELTGLPGRVGLNIAYEAVDRHCESARVNKVAIRWVAKDETITDFTYLDLKKQSNRFANVLNTLGIGEGDRVFVLAGRIPATYITALGTLKNISVFCPLFSAFGPEPIQQRLQRGDGKLLVTTSRLYKRKVKGIRESLPDLKYVLITDIDEDMDETTLSYNRLMNEASDEFTIPPTSRESMAILHFTSG